MLRAFSPLRTGGLAAAQAQHAARLSRHPAWTQTSAGKYGHILLRGQPRRLRSFGIEIPAERFKSTTPTDGLPR
ncbi:protein of unknown function [Methylocella tundrae]|uniref:Uncharacterized protein n=1 Tax=Methylocella tundrae TaxID=227605 RepID=A0A4U8Z1Z5_METTU|nr:protein of unknown function [Methylocella tundrae]